MGTAIVILMILVIVIFSLKGSLKHLSGQGGCCGGGSAPKVKKKKLKNPVISTKTIQIEGMHCDACKNRVEAAINCIEGASATVHLKQKEAVVKLDRQVSNDELKEVVAHAGYKVAKIV